MPRNNIFLDEDLQDQLDGLVKTHGINKSKFIRIAIKTKIDSILSVKPRPAPAPPAPRKVRAAPPPAPLPYSNPYNIEALKANDGTPWFQLDRVCQALGLSDSDVLAQLDVEEDTVTVEGVIRIAQLGVNTALGLASRTADADLLTKFKVWIGQQHA